MFAQQCLKMDACEDVLVNRYLRGQAAPELKVYKAYSAYQGATMSGNFSKMLLAQAAQIPYFNRPSKIGRQLFTIISSDVTSVINIPNTGNRMTSQTHPRPVKQSNPAKRYSALAYAGLGLALCITLPTGAQANVRQHAQQMTAYDNSETLNLDALYSGGIADYSLTTQDDNGNQILTNKEGNDGFSRVISIADTPYNFLKMYDIYGRPIGSAQRLDKIEFGTVNKFDKDGKVTDSINRDEPYTFTLDDVIALMKSRYGKDIEQAAVLKSASRYHNDDHAAYVIYTNDGGLNDSKYTINGKTGTVISVEQVATTDDPIEFTEEKLNALYKLLETHADTTQHVDQAPQSASQSGASLSTADTNTSSYVSAESTTQLSF